MRAHNVTWFVLLLLFVATGTIFAQTPFTVTYDVVGLPPSSPLPESLSATVEGEGIQGLDLIRGPAIQPYGLTNGFSSNNWNISNPSIQGAIEEGAYYQFGFTVQPGYTVSLSTLDMALRRSAKSAPMNYEVQISFDDFATPGIPVAMFNYFGRTSGSEPIIDALETNAFYYMYSDLPGRPNSVDSPGDEIPTIQFENKEELQNIPGGTKVTIRLYAWGNMSTTETNTVALGRMIGPTIAGTVSAE